MAARNRGERERERWRELASLVAVVAALCGGAPAVSNGTAGTVDVALCGETCQHNQVLLT